MDSIIQLVLGSFGSLPDYLKAIAILIGGLVTTATAFTMATPTKIDDTYLPIVTKPLNWVLKLLNSVAGNVAKNKNADEVLQDYDIVE